MGPLSTTSVTKLRDFISAVRKCKSGAEEAALVAKECANIRNNFQDPASAYRHRNIAKLMFINMMGYPTQFGQLETVKLLASPHFLEKKLGYTALPVLLDHESDVLMLATNTIKNDVSTPNQYIATGALTALGNISSGDMAETLLREIEVTLGGSNPMLKKRAALLMAKVIRTNVEHASKVIPRLSGFFQERNHSMILGSMAIMTSVLESKRSDLVIQMLPTLNPMTRYLNDLLVGSSVLATSSSKGSPSEASGGYIYRGIHGATPVSIEYDINGVNDPILQTKILSFLRHLIENYAEVLDMEHWNLIVDAVQAYLPLADNYKNSAQALVYEACRTALALSGIVRRFVANSSTSGGACKLNSENLADLEGRCHSLLDQAMEWLDFFMSHKDNTHRYVAISTLAELAKENAAVVRRYQSTVVDCLKDPDPSIQKRAVNLAFELIDSANAIEMTTELLNLLLIITDPMPAVQTSRAPLGKDVAFADGAHVVVSSPRNSPGTLTPLEKELKRDLTMLVIQKIERAIDWWAPSRSWQLDSLIRLCCLAGNLVGDGTINSVVATIMATPELHGAALTKLFELLQENIYQVGFCEVAVWAFGDLIGSEKAHLIQKKDVMTKLEESLQGKLDPSYIERRETECTGVIPTITPAGDLLADNESSPAASPHNEEGAVSFLGLDTDDTTNPDVDENSPGSPISPSQAMDQIELVASILGLADLRTAIEPALQTKVQSLHDLIQNFDVGGVAGRVSDTCILSSPDPKTHEIKALAFKCFPQAYLPKETREALKESKLPHVILTAASKLAAKFPSFRPRVLRLLAALKSKCLRFEFQLKIAEVEKLLSPEVFPRFGQDILLVRCATPPARLMGSATKASMSRNIPIGTTDLVADHWPSRQSVMDAHMKIMKTDGLLEKAVTDEDTLVDDGSTAEVLDGQYGRDAGGRRTDLLDDLLDF